MKHYDKSNWKKVRLGDVVEYSKGTGLSKDKLYDKGLYSCILYGELFTRYKEIINTVYSKTNYIEGTPSVAGDVLLPGSTTTCGEDLAKASSLNLDDVLLGGDIIILRPNKKHIVGDFLSYLIPSYKREILKYTQGITIIHLQGKKLLDLMITIPSVDIQENIVKSIHKIDMLISNIEQLITKQEAIKKTTLKLLLEPKSDYNTVTLGDIVVLAKGEQLGKSQMDPSGEYMVMNGGITASGKTNKYNHLGNTITISEGGNSCGFVSFIKDNFWCGGHCYTLENLKVDTDYLYQLLKYREDSIMKLRVGSGLPNIPKNRLASLILAVINSKEHQKRIAAQLSEIDAHIENLKQQLAKQRAIKQGLMDYFFGN